MFGSQAARNLFLQSVFGDDRAAAAPANVYIALLRHPTDPDTVLGTEASGGSYARVAIDNEDASWAFSDLTSPSRVRMANAVEYRWPVASGVYSITDPLNQWAIFDNASSGNCLLFGELTTPITVTGAGDVPVIDVDDAVVVLT